MHDAPLDLAGHAAYLQALRRQLEASTGQPVECLQTHISSLLLTHELVYKFKKPLRLPFVDFSTAQRREQCCRDELRLNRRLAPSLYLRVVPVAGPVSAPHLGGEGTPIDHAVCMRRFPAGALLSQRLAEGRLLPEHIDALALRLAQFHAAAPHAAPQSPFGSPASVESRLQAVLDQLAAQHADASPVGAWALARCAALHEVLAQRKADGAVREVHGDLHLANTVVLADGEVTAFDCIEFDPALRWIDVMEDIAFTCMDLKARGRPELAWRLLDAYLQHGGDHAGLQVLRFYEVGRALVRALVGQLTPPGGSAAAVDYLACARRLVQEGDRGPRLALTCGVSGSGKSVLAAQLLEVTGAVRLRSDVERKRLFGLAPLHRSREAGVDLYTAEATQRTFEQLRERAQRALQAGYPVIVDAAFLRRAERDRFRQLAGELGVPFVVFHCTAGLRTLRERVADRAAVGADPSEATPEVLARQLEQQEAPAADERAWTLQVDTERPLDLAALSARWRDGSDAPACTA
jgi:aminoglycoside phosphotransferase family enzyme/predicted kinase